MTVGDSRNYHISVLCEFVDKDLEKEFLEYDIKRNAKFIKPVTLIFGTVYLLFFIFDYQTIKDSLSLAMILFFRVLFFISSVTLSSSKEKENRSLIRWITAYEITGILSFLMIMYFYESFTFLAFFSVITISLGLYAMPNRLLIAQIISLVFILSFYSLLAGRAEGVDSFQLFHIIAYNIIILVFCNIGSYLTNFYKRKQFADSRELLRLSVTDSLTGIYNRIKFTEELTHWVNFCNRYENPLSLVIFDIDDFKRVNDQYGHPVGDVVIQNIVSTVKKAIRKADIFARWGGEEFVILLPNTDIIHAREMTERMRISVQGKEFGIAGNVTCSFGLVAFEKGESTESLIQRADMLLYKAKDLGKNVVIFEAGNIGMEKHLTNYSVDNYT